MAGARGCPAARLPGGRVVGWSDEGFIAMQTCDDAVTCQLVGAVSDTELVLAREPGVTP